MDLSDIQGRYPVQPQIRILLPVLGFFLTYFIVWRIASGELSEVALVYPFIFALLLSCIAAAVIFFITKPYEKAESESSEIIKQIDGTTVLLLYILSFFIPLAGFIVGAIYASKDEEHYKHVGKNCLIFSVMNIVIGFIMVVAILGSM